MKERKLFKIKYRLMPENPSGEIEFVECESIFFSLSQDKSSTLCEKCNTRHKRAFSIYNIFINPHEGIVGVNLLDTSKEYSWVMIKHTQTPYEDTGNSEVIKIQDAVNFQTVAFLKPGYPQNKANAEFIVEACNNHAELVELSEVLTKTVITQRDKNNTLVDALETTLDLLATSCVNCRTRVDFDGLDDVLKQAKEI